jgi:hypothetical protein
VPVSAAAGGGSLGFFSPSGRTARPAPTRAARASKRNCAGLAPAAGLTPEALAFRAGVDRSSLAPRERDLKVPTLDRLFRLCGALGVRAADLVARVERRRRRGAR